MSVTAETLPPAVTGRGAGEPDPVSVESIITLYRQVPSSFAAALVVTAYMAFTAWPYSPHPLIWWWLAVQGLSQVLRLALYLSYRRRMPVGAELGRWAHAYTGYMLLAGLIWGGCMFLFVQPHEPLTVALTLCGLYGISAGSVPGNAYNLLGVLAFVGSIFALVLLKMLLLGDFPHIVLGIASALFAVIMVSFGRMQNRVLREGFDIRFENTKILAEMRAAREHAEAAWRQAEAANLAKSQFLAAASHDLRQPLYALSLFSGSLKSIALNEEGGALVKNIQDNISSMESLFNGLLDISRLDAGAVNKTIRPFALQTVFDRLEQYFAPIAQSQGLRFRLRPTSLWAASDEVLTEQILMNLIANALRYTPSGGVVIGARRRGRAGEPGGIVSLQVSDTGPGIAPGDQARIFDDFVQIGNTERDRRKGLGLGLAIARRTAALLGSRVALDTHPGKGARFSFELPRTDPGDVEPSAPLVQDADLIAGLRVLIVDDDQAVRQALRLLLTGWGLDFVVAGDLEEARVALAAGPAFQVVLCDYRLREGHVGLDFLQGLQDRAGGPAPGLCLITGDVEPEVMRRAREARILLIHKPVDPSRLRALLNHVASKSAAATPA